MSTPTSQTTWANQPCSHSGDVRLLFQLACDLANQLLLFHKWDAIEQCQLRTQHNHVETLGFFLLGLGLSGQSCDVAQTNRVRERLLLPGVRVAELLDRLKVRSHKEVAFVHRVDFRPENFS